MEETNGRFADIMGQQREILISSFDAQTAEDRETALINYFLI